MARLRLSPPWDIHYRKINELFKKDTGIKVVYDEDVNEVKLYVDDTEKAAAIGMLLPEKCEFGNVIMKITVIPANQDKAELRICRMSQTMEGLFKTAFKDNEIMTCACTLSSVVANDVTFVVFKKEVVQFFDDNLFDLNGVRSTLYQDIAEDVFGDKCNGVYFCTEV